MSAYDPEGLVSALAPFHDAGRIWIAFSGGLDSTCLLHAAAAMRERLPGPLRAIHVDHGLHPSSGDWAKHCRTACETLAVALVSRRLGLKVGPGESLEAVARDARYGAFRALLEPGDLLLTAHNQDDQAETLLLALIRGSGVHGLAAMPFAAELGLGRLVRPLLEVPRAALEHYARARGLTWVDDPGNDTLALDRNYLRHRVLPLIRGRWPAVSATLSRSASHCAEAAAVMDQAAGKILQGLGGGRPDTLSIPGLLLLDTPLRKSVLRLWLRRLGFSPPDTAHLKRILNEVLSARPDAAPLVAWRGCEIRRYRGYLFALKPLPPVPTGQELSWSAKVLELPGPLGTLNLAHEQRPETTAQRGLSVRFGVTMPSCRPPGSDHNRSLKKLFQERGVPAWLRPYVPLVFDGGRLVAVAGVCRCAPQCAGEPAGPDVRWTGHPWEGWGFFC